MSRSGVILNQFDGGSITLSDGTDPTPLELTVLFDQADFSISGLSDEMTDVTPYQSRRTLHSIRRGALTFPTGSFSVMVSEFSETSVGTLFDLIHGTTGTPFAARVSTTAAKGDVTTFDLTLAVEGTDAGGVDGTLTFEDCHLTWDFSEGDPNTASFSFTVYGQISGDLSIAA
jgi:hypothetical protein